MTDDFAVARDVMRLCYEGIASNAEYGRGLEALDRIEARLKAAEERCPVCASNEWDEEWDYTGHDEVPVYRCQTCGWPSPSPHTIEEWRRQHFVSPYLRDLEAGLASAEAERDKARADAELMPVYRSECERLAKDAERLKAEVERLRAAGDALAAAVLRSLAARARSSGGGCVAHEEER